MVHEAADGWVALVDPDPDDLVRSGAFTVRLTRSIRSRCGDVPTTALAGLLARASLPAMTSTVDVSGMHEGGLAGILPPFAAAHRAGPDAAIVVAGDWLGMRQLFWWQGDGVAAVSTSALALAALAGAELDLGAVGLQSLVGHQVGLATMFAGVSKLDPGCLAHLEAGAVSVRRYAEHPLTPASDLPVDDVVDEMAQILREILTGYVTDHPDTILQLTGGQDSRLLLCAVPAPLRRGMHTLTLHAPGSADTTVATRLSAAAGLDHQIFPLDGQPPLDPATAYELALDAAIELDTMASPLALAPLQRAESALQQGHRLSGAGGETARGFYYAGQPTRSHTSASLIGRLASWRLFTNEAVAADALEPEFVSAARAAAQERIAAAFAPLSDQWLRATDEFYLYERTARWAGAHGTPAAVRRFYVNPLLDRRFMQLALGPQPADKKDSKLTGALIARLDPALSRIPLDSGLVPARLGRTGLAARTAVARVKAHKVVGKVRQRVSSARRAQLGAASMGELVLAHWRTHPDIVAPLRGNGVVRQEWLDGLLAGGRGAQPTTVAFLVNLLVATGVTGSGHNWVSRPEPASVRP